MGTANSTATPAPISQIPSTTHLPDQGTGWVATEFKEYNRESRTVVNAYKTLDRLGRGGFGTVYKVQHAVSKQIYALKYIVGDAYESAMKEATMMATLQHRSIVKVHSFFPLFDPKTQKVLSFCIIMDFVEGDNLREYLRKLRDPVPKVVVMEWFIKVLEALAYLHEQRIFHRDIKPENIIITTRKDTGAFDVILVDFGLAARAIFSEQNITVAGTFPYLSPDLLTSGGKAPLNGKADIWALGCVLYETWAQDSSFVLLPMGMAGRVITDPRFLEKTGDDISINHILTSMLKVNPDDRVTASDLLNFDAMKGWKAAIDLTSPERKVCPRSALALLPFISILKDKSARLEHCLSNLMFISKWQGVQDFQRVLIDFNFASTLVEVMDHHFLLQSPKSATQPLNAMCVKVLNSLVGNVMGDLVVYQICSHPIGIHTLLRVGAFDVILRILHVRFGFFTLRNCYALDHLVHTLMISNNEEHARGGIGLFEDLPSSTIPTSAYMDSFVKIIKEPGKQVRNIADLLYNHEDVESMIADADAFNRLKDFISTSLFAKSDHTDRLLAALLRTALPTSRVKYEDCINHRVCTTMATGSNKYHQYIWVCQTCNTAVCYSCARKCHTGCKGEFVAAVARCRCADRSMMSNSSSKPTSVCQCLEPEPAQNNNSAKRPASTTSSLGSSLSSSIGATAVKDSAASFAFDPKPILLDPPQDPVQLGSGVRFWATTQELKSPPFSHAKKEEPRFYLRNKGFVYTLLSTMLTTVFYYEIEILAPPIGKNAAIGVGLTLRDSPPPDKQMVGWTTGWGYHGDDGKKYCGGSNTKGSIFGPIFSTGDRVGCGVLSDGTVFFTLNGILLGIPSPDEPRVPTHAHVVSTVSFIGAEAHVKFFFERSEFVFNPSNMSVFEPVAYLQDLTNKFCNLQLLRESFGPENIKILDLLAKVDVDLAVSLLYALSVDNPGIITNFRSHPLYLKIGESNSLYAHRLVHIISQQSKRGSVALPQKSSDRISTDKPGDFGEPPGNTSEKGEDSPSSEPQRRRATSILTYTSDKLDQNLVSNAELKKLIEQIMSMNVNLNTQKPPSPIPNPTPPTETPPPPSFSPPPTSSSTFQSPPQPSTPHYRPPPPQGDPPASFSSEHRFSPPESVSFSPAPPSQAYPVHPTESSSFSPSSAHPTYSSSFQSSPFFPSHSYPISQSATFNSSTLSFTFVKLIVSLASDPEDWREVVLSQEQKTMQGLISALRKHFSDVTIGTVEKIVKEVRQPDNSVMKLRLTADDNVQALRSNDKIVFYCK